MSDWPACIAVAYSGGRDSTALLYATARAALEHPGLEVVALHVHHGISLHADAWLAHAEQQCLSWAAQGLPIRLLTRRLSLALEPGASVEAVARHARYDALASMAREVGAELVLLAHHRQDQAETFLLQALRGAGVAGLAGMPAMVERKGITWGRPWLNRDRSEIETYVEQHGLTHVEDDTNLDPRYARNRLRLLAWPALREQFPQVDVALTQAARHSADAHWCLQQWAAQTLPALLATGLDGEADAHRLDASAWTQRPGPERRELLRYWYGQIRGGSLSRAWIERLDREVPLSLVAGRAAHWPDLDLGLYRGHLIWQPQDSAATQAGDEASGQALSIDAPGRYELARWGGALCVREAAPSDLGVPWSLVADLRVVARSGGEDFQIAANRPARSLKKQFQAAGVPAWARAAPLFFSANRLVFVPALGLDARVALASEQSRACLTWVSLPVGDVTG